MPVFTAAAAYVATAIGVTSVIGIAAINFGIRILATMVLTSLITRKGNQAGANSSAAGARVQVPPATNNKLTVSYGDAYLSPAIVDAKISTDQQYMWYVCAFSEVTDSGTFSFDDPSNAGFPLMYWGDKKVKFDTVDRTKVVAFVDTTTGTPIEDTKVNGFMNVYFYRDGSSNPLYGAPNAVTVMSDSTTGGGIATAQRWTSSNKMNKTVFCIVRLKYNQEDSKLTGINQITAYVRNTLTVPGDVMVDYLKNTRYGCGVDISLIDVPAFTEATQYSLNGYSNQNISYNDNGTVKVQPRYRINGPIDTSQDCLTNALLLSDACDSWLQWDETAGKWSVVINRSFSQAGIANASDLFAIYADTIKVDQNGNSTPANNYAYAIGGIDIIPIDLNSTFNKVEVQFPSYLIKDQMDFAYIQLPSALMNPNEPVNSLTLQLPQVNDDVQAQYIGTRRLAAARDDLIVTVTTDYGGIQCEAGDVIRVYHEMYGWSAQQGFPNGKLFRVTQVQETKTEDGFLGARLVLSEYNDTIYGDNDINAFQPSPNTGITDPTVISKPVAPTVSNVVSTSVIPNFLLSGVTPAIGSVSSMEIWYQLSSTAPTDANNFKLWEVQFYGAGPIYPNGTSFSTTISGLPAAGAGQSYYFRVRAVGSRSKSQFSENSTAFNWAPNPTATVTGQNFQAVYQPSPVTAGVFANGQPDLANVSVKLYGYSGPGQVDYTTATSNASMANSTWRIDIANISYTNITFSSNPTDGGTYAQWPAPTSLTGNVATISSPIIYKDSTGNTYISPPAVVNVNKTLPGDPGERGIVTLAYVPVTYDPTIANDSALSTSFSTTTDYPFPITGDGAVFYNTGNSINTSARKYDSNATPAWQFAVLEVPGSVITANSISNTQVRFSTITADRIAAGTITAQNIATRTLTADKIAANTITTAELQAGNISGNVITAGTLNGNVIIANTVNGNVIQANTLDANSITAGTITSDKIAANAITAGTIAANAVTAGTIAANAITAGTIAANAITSNSLASFSVTAGKIAAGAITASSIAANTITFENLVIGAVTQSRSTTSDPIVKPIPFYNWDGAKTWPDDTRAIWPPGGATLIPTTDPTSSANVEYTEGSRIQVGFSVKLFCSDSGSAPSNLVELWKSGASSIYDRGVNTIRHSYNLTGTLSPNQTIHAYGYGGIDFISTDGGQNWSILNNSSTDQTITGGLTYYYNSGGTAERLSIIAGPLQNGDTPTLLTPVNFGKRTTTSGPLQFDAITLVGGQNYRQSYNAMEVAPFTGGNGSGSAAGGTYASTLLLVGAGGRVLYNDGPINSIISGSSSWVIESTGGLLQDLYAVYAGPGDATTARNYTAVAVGGTGSILRSSRTNFPASSYGWNSQIVNKLDGTPLLTDLYGVASNDTAGGSQQWIAVGQYGMVMRSTNDGSSWTQVETPTPVNLNSVRYCNGTWVIVGDEGVILTSTTGTSWTQIQSTLTDKNLYTIDYSYVHNRINISGDGVILNSSAATVNFANVYAWSPAESYDLSRLAWWGSNELVNDKTVGPPEQQILNGQIVSGTVVDTQYVAGQETTYYLVVGNMAGSVIKAGQAYLQAQEIKR